MSKHFGQPLKVFGECYPNNIYYDQWENGTYFKSRGYFQLWQFESKIANGIEIVTEISSSNQTHPIVSCRQFAILQNVVNHYLAHGIQQPIMKLPILNFQKFCRLFLALK